MRGTFHIEIALGNDAMQTRDQIAELLVEVGERLEKADEQQGPLRDANGSRVGSFWFEEESA